MSTGGSAHTVPPAALVLRPSTADDFEALCRVHDLARPDELAGSCDPRAFVPLARDPEAAELPEYAVTVACLDGEVVGFSGVRRAYIGWLYVDPAHYGRGIGRALLRAAIALGGEDSWTIALVNNTRARRLYESEGFGVLESIESHNAGYSCVGVKLALDAGPGADDAVRDSVVADSSVLDSSVAGSSVRDSSVAGSSVLDSSVLDSSVLDSSVLDSSVLDSSVAGSSVADSSVCDSSVGDSSVADSSVRDSSVSDSCVADSSVPDSSVGDSAVPESDAR